MNQNTDTIDWSKKVEPLPSSFFGGHVPGDKFLAIRKKIAGQRDTEAVLDQPTSAVDPEAVKAEQGAHQSYLDQHKQRGRFDKNGTWIRQVTVPAPSAEASATPPANGEAEQTGKPTVEPSSVETGGEGAIESEITAPPEATQPVEATDVADKQTISEPTVDSVAMESATEVPVVQSGVAQTEPITDDNKVKRDLDAWFEAMGKPTTSAADASRLIRTKFGLPEEKKV